MSETEGRSTGTADASRERRHPGERRRYNRRGGDEQTPPYYEAFERIAQALEGIRDSLGSNAKKP